MSEWVMITTAAGVENRFRPEQIAAIVTEAVAGNKQIVRVMVVLHSGHCETFTADCNDTQEFLRQIGWAPRSAPAPALEPCVRLGPPPQPRMEKPE